MFLETHRSMISLKSWYLGSSSGVWNGASVVRARICREGKKIGNTRVFVKLDSGETTSFSLREARKDGHPDKRNNMLHGLLRCTQHFAHLRNTIAPCPFGSSAVQRNGLTLGYISGVQSGDAVDGVDPGLSIGRARRRIAITQARHKSLVLSVSVVGTGSVRRLKGKRARESQGAGSRQPQAAITPYCNRCTDSYCPFVYDRSHEGPERTFS